MIWLHFDSCFSFLHFKKKYFWIFLSGHFLKVFRFTFLSIGSALVKCNQISGDLCRTWSVTHSKLKLLPVHEVLSTCWLNWKKAGMPRCLGSQILESLEQVLMSSDQVTIHFFWKGCLGVSTLSCRAQAFWGRSSAWIVMGLRLELGWLEDDPRDWVFRRVTCGQSFFVVVQNTTWKRCALVLIDV